MAFQKSGKVIRMSDERRAMPCSPRQIFAFYGFSNLAAGENYHGKPGEWAAFKASPVFAEVSKMSAGELSDRIDALQKGTAEKKATEAEKSVVEYVKKYGKLPDSISVVQSAKKGAGGPVTVFKFDPKKYHLG